MSGERRSASDERRSRAGLGDRWRMTLSALVAVVAGLALGVFVFDSVPAALMTTDRKSTRLNSSHVAISYAVFCLKTKGQRRCRSGAVIILVPSHLPLAALR